MTLGLMNLAPFFQESDEDDPDSTINKLCGALEDTVPDAPRVQTPKEAWIPASQGMTITGADGEERTRKRPCGEGPSEASRTSREPFPGLVDQTALSVIYTSRNDGSCGKGL